VSTISISSIPVPGTGAGVAMITEPGLPSLLVRVHEWVDGALPTAPATKELGAALGEALAALHRLQVHCGTNAQVDPWYRAAHGAAHWRALADRAAHASRSWARRLDAALPLLAEAEALVAARAAEVVPLRVCHSDLVPGNVLVPPMVDRCSWTGTTPDPGTPPRNSPPRWSAGPPALRVSRTSRSRPPWSRATSEPVAR
jgi:Phosphotransferase enzyme family